MNNRRLPRKLVRLAALTAVVGLLTGPRAGADDGLKPVSLKAAVRNVQPMTGIVLWATNGAVATAPIQLEYSYMPYREVVSAEGTYDWTPLDRLLEQVAARKHQLVLRWHDTYVAHKTGVPAFITQLPGYRLRRENSEGKPTEFPDWSSPELKSFVLEFFTRFSERYDRDPRLAFVQVGFGLWAEYHIYDGPMEIGATFPSREFQGEFLQHLSRTFVETPWMISIDAAESHGPFEMNPALRKLPFGLFDDSFNQKQHAKWNAPNWELLGRDRWQTSPGGGEFSFFEKRDQAEALSPKGPHGIPFEEQARRFHVSFILGDAQPNHQSADRIRQTGQAIGYRFRVTDFRAGPDRSLVTIENTGIAPIYYDAHPAVNGTASSETLKGLLPGASRTFDLPAGGKQPQLTIQCRRLSPGQKIEFDADL